MEKLARHQTSLFLSIIIILGVLIGFGLYVSTGYDDAHITFFPAYTLAELGEIQNYNGERVEQSSTLLFTLLLALFSKLTGIDVAVWAYILPIVFYGVVIVLVYVLANRLHANLGLLAAFVVSITPYLLYWTFGKMEVTLTAAILLGAILLYHDFLARPLSARLVSYTVLITLAMAMVRPEMPFVLSVFMVTLGLVVLVRHFICKDDGCAQQNRQIGRRLFGLVEIIALVLGGLFLARYAYFGVWFPQPVYAKVGHIHIGKIIGGIGYMLGEVVPLLNITLLGTTINIQFIGIIILSMSYLLVIHIADRLKSLQLNIVLVFSAVYTAYIVTTGGDWMEAGRFNVVILPLFLLSVLLVANHFFSKLRPKKRARRAIISFAVLLYGLQLVMNSQFVDTRAAGSTLPVAIDYANTFTDKYYDDNLYWFERVNRINLRDIPTLYYMEQAIDTLRTNTETRPLYILSRQQGIISYYLARRYPGEIYIYDRAGLIEGSLINCEKAQNLPQDTTGVRLSYEQIFAHDLFGSCNLNPPDIIFDTRQHPAIQENDYTLYFDQQGNVPLPNNAAGKVVPAVQKIYVRSELLPADFAPTTINFHDLLKTG